jgi:HEAT repeat protein
MDVLQDISNWTRDKKIQYLKALADDEEWSIDAFPVLEILMADEDPEVRSLAVTGLWDYPRSQIIDRLFDLVLHDPSQDVRSKAVVTLGRYVYEGEAENLVDADTGWMDASEDIKFEQLYEEDFLRVKDFLVNLINDEGQSLDTRRFGIEAISFLNTPEMREIIARAYAQPDLKMKVSAVFAMGRGGDRGWWNIILQELESPTRELRFEAVRAAGEGYLTEASPILMRLAQSNDDLDLKLEAIWSLGKTGGPGARQFLSQATRSKNEDVREIAEAALEELGLSESLQEDFDDEAMDDLDEADDLGDD